MLRSLYGFKVDQSQSFNSQGIRMPITRLQVWPNIIVAKKTNDDGRVVVAIGHKKNPNKPWLGLFKGINEKISPRYLREIKTKDLENLNVGAAIKMADVFAVGDMVDVVGISKGKGFAGVVKRHHFRGGPRTHGQSDRERAPGSIGQTTTPGRVYKGKRMAGRMGNEQVTIENLVVVGIDEKENLLIVKGLVPGGRNSLVLVKKTKN